MKTSLKSGTIFLSISSFVFIISGYVINVFLGRYLGPHLYGTYGVIISIISILNILQTSGFTQAASKYIAEDESKADSIFSTTVRIQGIFTLAIIITMFLASDFIAHILNDPSLSGYIKLSTLIFPLYGFYGLLVDYFNGLHYFKKQALINIVYSLSKALLVLVFAYFFRLYGVIYAFILSPILAMFFGFHFPKLTTSLFPFKKIILFSLPLVGFALFSSLLQSTDLYFVKSMLNGNETGYYAASQNISRLLYFVTIPLSSVLLPSVSQNLSQNFIEKLQKTIETSIRVILFIVVPGAFLISATSLNILALIYSHTYINAAPILSILAISVTFYTIFFLLCTILNGGGSPVISSVLSILGVVLTGLLCLFFIPLFAAKGAALASTLSNLVILVISAIFVYKKFKINLPYRSGIKILGSSLLIYFLALIIKMPTLLLPFEYIFLGIIYLLSLYLLREITPQDVELARSLVPEWVQKKLS